MKGGCFLDALKTSADHAERLEADFRREVADRARILEQARTFAFRRLELMRRVAEAIASAESEDIAVARGISILRTNLGWSSDSDARSEALSRFMPVARAVFASLAPPLAGAAKVDAVKELSAFESWYASTHGRPFWTLSVTDHHIPELSTAGTRDGTAHPAWTDFDSWLAEEFALVGTFTVLAVLVEIAETKVRPLCSTYFNVIGSDTDWNEITVLFEGAGIAWDGAAFFPVVGPRGGPLEDPAARQRLRELETRLDKNPLVLNEGNFFDRRGRKLRVGVEIH